METRYIRNFVILKISVQKTINFVITESELRSLEPYVADFLKKNIYTASTICGNIAYHKIFLKKNSVYVINSYYRCSMVKESAENLIF